MSNIKLSDNLQSASPEGKRIFINSDETWAFTERPKRDMSENNASQIPAHDLFNLFTADIIREKTLFTR